MSFNVYQEVGDCLREARLSAGLYQAQVANMLDINRWVYNRVENGHLPFKREWLEKLPLNMRRPMATYFRALHLEQAAEMNRLSQPVPVKRPIGATQIVPRLMRPGA